MQAIKRNSPNAGYETDDVITLVDDGHQWSPAELNSVNFTVETGLTLSESDVGLLTQEDVQRQDVAVSQLATFRDATTGRQFAKKLHRRKYQNSGNTVTIKSNAQNSD